MSVPTLQEFNPQAVPWQYKAICDIHHYDYSEGTHEVLFSGSVGCLREDALVETVFGKVPICDIKKSDYLLSYHEKSGQFALNRGSGAFPKGKGNLYRVVSEHGEYVANGAHLVSTSLGVYQSVEELFYLGGKHEFLSTQIERHHEKHRKLFLSSVLNCSNIVVNLINHCVERIHQCGLQLPSDLNAFLNAFPFSIDAQEYGLFFYKNKHVHRGDFQVPEPTHSQTVQSPFQIYMHDFFLHVESKTLDEEDACTQGDLALYEHKVSSILAHLLCHSHTAHPQDLLFFLSKFCSILSNSWESPNVITNNAPCTIEKLGSQDWYWDMQVPNTHNYIASGHVHHNSAKSLLLAHMIIVHCLSNKGAHVLIGRASMPHLKDTLFQMILDHLGEEVACNINGTRASIQFPNGSKISSWSWSDKKYKKVRSYALSMAVVEELTENEQWEFYKELKMRVGRIPHIKQNLILCATNPDSPAHWAHKYFIAKKHPMRHVYYSLTEDNPFLPKTYIQGIRETLGPKEVRRMLYGEWIEIATDVIYYNYSTEKNFIKTPYEINKRVPIDIFFDFNIAEGKPMSAGFGQVINGKFHCYKSYIVHGANTEQIVEEMAHDNLFENHNLFRIFGDAAGRHRDTRSNNTDYDIIYKYLKRYKRDDLSYPEFEMHVPKANPPVRDRHNYANGAFCNSEGTVNFYCYDSKIDEGLRLTRLKKGGNYIEDDSFELQHVTTAVTYWISYIVRNIINQKRTQTIQL